MVQDPQRTVFSGPTLVRLLARLTEVDVSHSGQSLSDRLSQWLGWTDAIALSSALNGSPPEGVPSARASDAEVDKLCAGVRTSLVHAIAGDSAAAAAKRRGTLRARAEAPKEDAASDYPLFRQRYLALQQAMETEIGNLRGRLRAMLAARAPGMARLALVDAIMERALGERERTLLASIPALLKGHFERLRAAAGEAMAEAQTTADAPVQTQATAQARSVADTAAARPDAWLNVFRKDMQSVLLAELEVRFQPVEGLLAALRTS
jgi:hypothetical protein